MMESLAWVAVGFIGAMGLMAIVYVTYANRQTDNQRLHPDRWDW